MNSSKSFDTFSNTGLPSRKTTLLKVGLQSSILCRRLVLDSRRVAESACRAGVYREVDLPPDSAAFVFLERASLPGPADPGGFPEPRCWLEGAVGRRAHTLGTVSEKQLGEVAMPLCQSLNILVEC